MMSFLEFTHLVKSSYNKFSIQCHSNVPCLYSHFQLLKLLCNQQLAQMIPEQIKSTHCSDLYCLLMGCFCVFVCLLNFLKWLVGQVNVTKNNMAQPNKFHPKSVFILNYLFKHKSTACFFMHNLSLALEILIFHFSSLRVFGCHPSYAKRTWHGTEFN